MGMHQGSGNRGLFAGGAALEFAQAPPRMDVKFPILGFLVEAEATGYDLKNRFQDPVGFFYRVSDGSIYPALKKLAHDGLVTLRTERQGRRTRKVYAITARGREHFRRMLREPAQPLFVFDESQVKIYFADQEPEIALEHLERSRIDDETRTAILAQMVTEMRRAGADVRCGTIAIVELGRAITEAKAQVLAKLCAQLKREILVKRRITPRSKQGRRVEQMLAPRPTRRPFPRGERIWPWNQSAATSRDRNRMDEKYAIDLEHVTRIYKRDEFEVRALDDVTVQIPSGRFVAIMGPSGSGKTTMLNLVAGIDHATTGRVAVGGEEITGMKERDLAGWRARHIGLVFQFYNLIPVLTAFENVELPLLLTSLNKAERREHVETALRVVGLADRMDHYPRQLSGGQEQRVAIARAIVADPTIIVADEPTGDLDAQSAEEILGLLVEMNRQFQKTIVMVTHDPRAERYVDTVYRLDKGLLVGVEPGKRGEAAEAVAQA